VMDGRQRGKLPFYGLSPWRSGDGAQGHLEEGSVDRCGGIGAWHVVLARGTVVAGIEMPQRRDCSHGGMCRSGVQLLQ
jgi:hypothetical protein